MRMESLGIIGLFGGLLLIAMGMWVMRYAGAGDNALVFGGLLAALGGYGAAYQAAITWRDGAVFGLAGVIASAFLVWFAATESFAGVTAVDPSLLKNGAVYGSVFLGLIMAVQTLIEAVRAIR